MESALPIAVRRLFHYPVKGLSPQELSEVKLEAGKGFPFDRIYAIARHNSGYDPAAYKPLPKTNFIVLVREERLAGLKTHFDPATHILQIRESGRTVLDENLGSEEGRRRTALFFAGMFDLHGERQPAVAVGGDNRFTDISVHSEAMMNAISIINLNSIRDLETRTGAKIDPLRFRANMYIDGLPAYQELDLPGQEVIAGTARLRIVCRTKRCAATDVNPETAARDLTLPRMLMDQLGHSDMGVYAEVIEGGVASAGTPVRLG